jgi:hypothetical protein
MSRSLFGFRNAKEKIVDKIYHFFKFKENIVEDFIYNGIHYDLVIINPNGFFVFKIFTKNDELLTKEGVFARDIDISNSFSSDVEMLIKGFDITCPVFKFLIISNKCNIDYQSNYSLENFYKFSENLPRIIDNKKIDDLYFKIKSSIKHS